MPERKKISDLLAVAAAQNVKEKNFWLSKLSGDPVKSYFPYDNNKTTVNERRPGTVKFTFTGELFAKLLRISNGIDHMLHMVLVAGVISLLYKYTDINDTVIGMPIYKQESNIEFINTVLALRNQINAEMSFKELLQQVKKTIIEAAENQNYPLEVLVDQLNIPRFENNLQLFDIVVLLENIHDKNYIRHIHTNMIFSFFKTGNCIEGVLEYNSLRYEKTTGKRMITHFKHLMERVLFKVDLTLSNLDILPEEEKQQILFEFNHPAAGYPKEKTIHELFLKQVERTPDHVALLGQIPNPKSQIPNKEESFGQILNALGGMHLSYRELNNKSDYLAYFLKEKGVQSDTIVGIMEGRSMEMIIGILGILKAGSAYLPIDADYPKERIDYMLADSGAKFLVSMESEVSEVIRLRPLPWNSSLERDAPKGRGVSKPAASSSNPAYIIYTSGTTGKPKGMLVQHRNVVSLMFNDHFQFDFSEWDIWTLFHSSCFDFSVWEMHGALLYGGKLVIVPKMEARNTGGFLELLKEQQVTILNQTPSSFYHLAHLELKNPQRELNLRYVIFGGEALNPGKLKEWKVKYPGIKLINMYGITETTVHVTFKEQGDHEIESDISNIGKPIPTLITYVIDKYLNLQPIGIAGELCIGGHGVGRGYLNNLELTNDKFLMINDKLKMKEVPFEQILNTFGEVSSDLTTSNKKLLRGVQGGGFLEKSPPGRRRHRIYKSGDLARWLDNGELEYRGRIDHQVKIRGFRIEPGEIESQLLSHGQVKEGVVIQREDEGSDKYLCAYIVSHQEIPVPELREYLSKKLPDYMIPAYFVQMAQIPLTPNGKLDKKALPEPQVERDEEFRAPRNETEEKLAEIWSEVLGIGKNVIGIDANFFHLGGYSLKAAMVVTRIHKELNIKVPLTEIFIHPTIRELSEKIEKLTETKYTSLEPTEEKEYYALSSAQRRLYILYQIGTDNLSYNMPQVLPLGEEIDKEKLEKTLKKLIARHESFRTSFELIDEKPVQKIHKTVDYEVECYELEANGLAPLSIPTARSSQQAAGIIENFIRPFNLSKVPLLRVGLIETAGKEHFLVLDIHHIITDGISQQTLTREFKELYAGRELPPLKLRYKDYSQWQNSDSQKRAIKKQENYWLKQLEGEIPVLNLPIDYVRPVIRSFEGSKVNFTLDDEKTGKLKRIVREEGTTLYVVLLTIYNIFLSRISSQEDIVVGIPTAGRKQIDLEPIIGMFVNTLALRSCPSGEKTFKTFLHQVKDRILPALENQDYPLEELVEKLMPERDMSRNPLFDVMFVLDEVPGTSIETHTRKNKNLEIKHRFYNRQTSKFDLTLNALEKGGKLEFTFEYCTKLFRKDTILRFIKYFKKIISMALDNPVKKISKMEIISEEEKKQILYDFNNTGSGYPKNKTMHELFEEQAGKKPDHTALIGLWTRFIASDSGKQPIHITYREVNNKAHQLAHLMQVKGVQPDTIVGIIGERSIEMIIGLLGILKAGCAYLPIDPDYPEERIHYMLTDSGANLLAATHTLTKKVERLRSCEGKKNFDIVLLEFSTLPSFHPSTLPSFHPSHSSNLAYIMYTSGTTGRPKGVMVEHKSAVNVLNWFGRQYYLGVGVRVLLMSDYTFDASVNQVFGTLLHGALLYVINKQLLLDIKALRSFIQDNKINIIYFVPMLLKELLECERKLESLEIVISGADRLEDKTKNMILGKGYRLYNHYGPTEATIDALAAKCSGDRVNLGRPISNAVCYILDKYGNMLPVGVSGELVVAGTGVARGYLNQPELTAEKFCLTPIPHSPYSTIYRTGDLARWLPNGNVEFLGRIDHQVKIRGYRIEIGEIESQLLKQEEIKEAVVVIHSTHSDNGTGKYLCAYIVGEDKIDISKVKRTLSTYLPDYMIPPYFVQIEKIPLTSNGKIDRNTLPEPETETGEEYVPPRNSVEEKLVEIWSEVLDIDTGINYNFFLLGGNSLKAMVMIAKIYKYLNAKIPLAWFFKVPTIKGLSEYIENIKKSDASEKYKPIEAVEKKDYYVLSSAQKRLFVLQQMAPEDISYNVPYIYEIEGISENEKLKEIFQKLIKRYESLRTSFQLVEEEVVQRIHETVDFQIDYFKIRSMGQISDQMKHNRINEIITSFINPFDLTQPPFLRVGLIETGDNKAILMVDMHHIIADWITHDILARDFVVLYIGKELPHLRVHYKDYAEWQNNEKEREVLKKQEDYWLKEFPGEIPVLHLPIDYPGVEKQSFEGGSIYFEVSDEELYALKKLAYEEEATLFMVLLAIYNILLSKISSQEDIIVGTAAAGRQHPDLEPIVGMFVNTLALRNFPKAEKTFTRFLRELNKKALEAFENQDYQFDELVKKIYNNRDLNHNPLFDVMFAFNTHYNTLKKILNQNESNASLLKIEGYRYEKNSLRFDMILTAIDRRDKLYLIFQYSTERFKEKTIERFTNYFREILNAVLLNKEIKLNDIAISHHLELVKSQVYEKEEGDFEF